MYYFIFYFVYKGRLIKDGALVARYSACLIVSIALGIHLTLLYSILRFMLCYFDRVSIARSNPHVTRANDLINLSIFFAIGISTYIYINRKRVESIVNRYNDNESFYSPANIVKFICLFLFPLLVSIFLVNNSVSYCQ